MGDFSEQLFSEEGFKHVTWRQRENGRGKETDAIKLMFGELTEG